MYYLPSCTSQRQVLYQRQVISSHQLLSPAHAAAELQPASIQPVRGLVSSTTDFQGSLNTSFTPARHAFAQSDTTSTVPASTRNVYCSTGVQVYTYHHFNKPSNSYNGLALWGRQACGCCIGYCLTNGAWISQYRVSCTGSHKQMSGLSVNPGWDFILFYYTRR